MNYLVRCRWYDFVICSYLLMRFKFRKFHFLEVNEVIEVIASLEVNDVT